MSPELALAAKRAAELLLLPPAGPLWLVLLGLWLQRGRATGRALVVLGVVLAAALSTQGVGRLLLAPLERQAGPALDEAALRALMKGPEAPQAIVILGGGLRSDRHEQPYRYRPHPRTTERLLYGAWAAQVTGLPVLVSGGPPRGAGTSEAAVMKRMLENRLGTRVRWLEDRSLDTADNARFSAQLLVADGRRRVLLVTHATHMRRARAAFAAAGLEPRAAPLGFRGAPVHRDWLAWLPSADGALSCWLALHEMAGGLWYRLRGLN